MKIYQRSRLCVFCSNGTGMILWLFLMFVTLEGQVRVRTGGLKSVVRTTAFYAVHNFRHYCKVFM
jgi:hypothetical protein